MSATSTGVAMPANGRAARGYNRDDVIQRIAIVLIALWLVVTVLLPIWSLLSKSFESADGKWVGLDNYITYFSTPSLLASLWNSLFVSALTTCIVLPLAFLYAYALTRSRMPAKGFFQAVSLLPILAPSLLPAIALVYLFGNQGLFKAWFPNEAIYGWPGIVIAQVFYCFPHALIILITALSTADARLYEAAEAMGAKRWRVFWTVTLPGARYGVISAGFVVFTLVITDFGIAKVIGGRFNVLATDIYKQVIGQQNFHIGAVVGFILLAPAVLSFAVDRLVQRKQVALLSARAVPFVPKARLGRDAILTLTTLGTGLLIIAILGMALWAPFIQYWPYNLGFVLDHFDFDNVSADGWKPYWVSIKIAAAAAVFGTAMVFFGAYLVEKGRGFRLGRGFAHFIAMMPLAVPGLVLGLGYIFFFNAAGNPLNFLYATLAILVINTIAHFYTVAHLTAVTALKQIDAEFESVSASLKVPFHITLWRVTIPICLPAILDIAIYFFVNAMTTVSAVIFLRGTDTPAAVAIVQMEEAGRIEAAAAMAALIVATSAGVKILHVLLARVLNRRTQAWRRR